MQSPQIGEYPPNWPEIAKAVKDAANWTCVRCGHVHDPEHGYMMTVHHLDGNKSNCEWWNIVPLCQRCHLKIQGKVVMNRPWYLDHTQWFKEYVAGYYAHMAGLTISRAMCDRFRADIIDLGQQRIDIDEFYTRVRAVLWDEYNTDAHGRKATIHDERHGVCPFCLSKTDAEFVDVGVGLQQCGPNFCAECGATEIGPGFTPETDEPQLCGWYKRKPPTEKELWQAVVTSGSSDHPYNCTCDSCLTWWISLGPEDINADGTLYFGPFPEKQIRARLGDQADKKLAAWKRSLENQKDGSDDDE